MSFFLIRAGVDSDMLAVLQKKFLHRVCTDLWLAVSQFGYSFSCDILDLLNILFFILIYPNGCARLTSTWITTFDTVVQHELYYLYSIVALAGQVFWLEACSQSIKNKYILNDHIQWLMPLFGFLLRFSWLIFSIYCVGEQLIVADWMMFNSNRIILRFFDSIEASLLPIF